MGRRRGLGSGLDALIPGALGTENQLVRQLRVASVRENRSQPRTRFDELALEELATSIREHGLIQPIIVVEDSDGGYELIAGERRLRAARRAGLETIPALVKQATPLQLLELALVENVQRADLNPLEEGFAYQTLKDEFGLSDEQIARRVGKSRVAVVNARRLIKLIDAARQALLDGLISAGHGRALLRFQPDDEQAMLLDLIQRRELSVRESERIGELAEHKLLVPSARTALLNGSITAAHAAALLRVEDPHSQGHLLEKILTGSLSVRETERVSALIAEGVDVDRALEPRSTPQILGSVAPAPPVSASRDSANELRPAQIQSPEDVEAQRLFEEILESPVQLIRSANSIRVVITLYSDAQLQNLYDKLGGTH